jgi:hypothetical protein
MRAAYGFQRSAGKVLQENFSRFEHLVLVCLTRRTGANAVRASLRTVGPRHAEGPISPIDRNVQEPRVATHLAVLHERARDVHLDVDLDVLSAVGARDDKILLEA